jgi:hypothetical protein
MLSAYALLVFTWEWNDKILKGVDHIEQLRFKGLYEHFQYCIYIFKYFINIIIMLSIYEQQKESHLSNMKLEISIMDINTGFWHWFFRTQNMQLMYLYIVYGFYSGTIYVGV